MKESVRYQFALIPGKIRGDVRITIDTQRPSEYSSESGDAKNISMNFLPIISVTIVRPSTVDETGKRVRAPWNPADSLGMTKYNFPLFVRQMKALQENMKTPDLYTYVGERLELNEKKAETIRDVFPIGNVTVELSAVVIVQETPSGDKRIEGVKIKFNNEQSSVILTLNELDSLVYNMEHLDIDSISFLMYLNFITRPKFNKSNTFNESTLKPLVDILPKEDDFD